MNKQLIITGDDYGMCAPVNRAIEECLAAGTMRATCVMANMPCCGEAELLRRQFPRSSVGLHWNLTQGRPVLGPQAVPSLVNTHGEFAGALRHQWLSRRINYGEIRAELVAQYERFRALAGAADFWNTHQNVHVFPGLFQFFVGLGKELGIPAMRSHERFTLPANGSLTAFYVRHPAYWLKGQVIRRWSRAARAQGTRMPDGRLYLPGYQAGNYALTSLLERIDWRNAGSAIELVVHPATTADDQLFGRMTESRVREYRLFRDAKLAGRLKNIDVSLVGFEALQQSKFGARGERAA
jgi:predicted glycoside hydrolase/deacetylase ChbG (UPF0249 family)